MEKAGQYLFPILSGIFFIPAEQPAKRHACRYILRLPPGSKFPAACCQGQNPPQLAARGQNPPQFAAGAKSSAVCRQGAKSSAVCRGLFDLCSRKNTFLFFHRFSIHPWIVLQASPFFSRLSIDCNFYFSKIRLPKPKNILCSFHLVNLHNFFIQKM